MGNMDLEELLQSWLISLRAEGKSPNTVRTYSAAVRGFLAGHDTLDRAGVREWLAGIPAPSTANLYCRSLQQFSRWLHEEGETDADVLLGIKPPQPADRLVDGLSPEEIAAMRKACSGNGFRDRRDLAVFEFMLSTGVRAAEAGNLKVTDVDMKQMTAVITRGKGGRPRLVPFGYPAAKALDRYLRLRRKHPHGASAWLWISERGDKLTYQGQSWAMRERAAQAGVDGFHLHRLRHSFASTWLRQGGSEGGLMTVAGWRSYKMITRYTQDTAQARALEEARRLSS